MVDVGINHLEQPFVYQLMQPTRRDHVLSWGKKGQWVPIVIANDCVDEVADRFCN
jgi:hypothetical protein